MKKFFAEFKAFATKGNVMDLAVGVIIGAAFQAIVNSFVNDLIMPFIGLLTGGINFNDQFAILKVPEGIDASTLVSLDLAKEAGATIFNYGAFITAVINFLIMAFVIFLFVKFVNKLTTPKKKEEAPAEPAAPTTKICPYCMSEIAIEATRCAHCTSKLDE
ncbi:MAG: large conductance mechanosensitive channel protein MscL [Lachnospiraceae bacterium]|nr:large conductance mechanosensitive channel protein MscL [Lachnospiraceae bacterium]